MQNYYVNTWNATGRLIAQTLVYDHQEGLREKAAAEKKFPYPDYQTFICPVKLNTGKKGFEQEKLFNH